MAPRDEPIILQATATAPPRSAGPGLTPHEPTPPSAGGPGSPPQPPIRRTGGGGGGGGDFGPGGPGGPGGSRKRLGLIAAIAGAIVLLAIIGVLSMGSEDNEDARIAAEPPTTALTDTPTPRAEEPTSPTASEAPAPSTPDAGGADPATTPQESSGGVAVDGAADDADAPDAEAEADSPLLTGASLEKITVKQGDTVRFRVKPETAQEVHVHGYDQSYEVGAGETKAIAFKAVITGIFEVEFEATGTQIAEITVEP